jgi:hypothetical protein
VSPLRGLALMWDSRSLGLTPQATTISPLRGWNAWNPNECCALYYIVSFNQ